MLANGAGQSRRARKRYALMNKLNGFKAMCKLASRENWCWKIFCGTCRHAYFRCGFLELAEGKHPHDAGWLSGQEHHHEMFRQLFDRSEQALRDPVIQRAFSTVLATASIERIAGLCKLPDWLGYCGLGLFHTQDAERNDRTLTKAWIPQFNLLLPEDASSRQKLNHLVDDPSVALRWQDLDGLELQLIGSKRK